MAPTPDATPSDDDPGCEHGGRAPSRRSPEVIERAAALFRAAGDPARLELLERLAAGARCVSELTNDGEHASTISQRLKTLRTAGLVSRRREGKHVYYALLDRHVADLIASALDHADEQT